MKKKRQYYMNSQTLGKRLGHLCQIKEAHGREYLGKKWANALKGQKGLGHSKDAGDLCLSAFHSRSG